MKWIFKSDLFFQPWYYKYDYKPQYKDICMSDMMNKWLDYTNNKIETFYLLLTFNPQSRRR